jgi:hypothetical protein
MITYLWNAFGDLLIFATALYAAYVMRKHSRISINLTIISAAFLIGAIVYARNLSGIDFHALMAFRYIIFSVFMIESTAYMIKGAENLRISSLLYAFMFVPFLSGNVQPEIIFGSSILISCIIVGTCFTLLLTEKKGDAQLLSVMGFIGAVYPISMIVYNPSILFAPWEHLFFVGKVFLAIFFLGLGLSCYRNMYYFCYRVPKRGRKK